MMVGIAATRPSPKRSHLPPTSGSRLLSLLQGPVQALWGHRQLSQSDARSTIDGVSNGRCWWHDGDLAHRADTVGVIIRRYFNNVGSDARDVHTGWDAVIEQISILEYTLAVKGISLGEGPTNALSSPALHLAFDLVGVDTQAHVLKRRVSENCDGAGVAVNLNIGHMHRRVRGNRHRAKRLAMTTIAQHGLLATYCTLRDGSQRHGAFW